ncbi:MAG: trehalose-6-phosphate synthase, partial [Dehalococcoidia bacterium]
WDGTEGTLWIGAGRGPCDRSHTDERGFELIDTPRGQLWHRRLYFDDETWLGHYAQAANAFLWPLLHLVREALPDLCVYYPAPEAPSAQAWAQHVEVNRAFASAALEAVEARNCWVHDYQLGLVPAMLREAGYTAPIGFFLHTPFPDLRVASRYLSEEGRGCFREFVAGILGADLVGVQSEADAERLRRAAVELGLASVNGANLRVGGRAVCVGAYPVGIDPDDVLEAADAAEPARVTEARARGLPVVLGLERADFTKGIPERLAAVEAVFRAGERFAYLGVASPTREGVPGYETLGPVIAAAAERCESAARDAGGSFRYAEEEIPWPEVVALQREADVVFTSSLADGLNLVPLQAAVAQSRRARNQRGVIISGRDAGVSQAFAGFEEDGLVPVDPLNKDAMVAALGAALRGEPGRISDRLIAAVSTNDARRWATSFLTDLEAASC